MLDRLPPELLDRVLEHLPSPRKDKKSSKPQGSTAPVVYEADPDALVLANQHFPSLQHLELSESRGRAIDLSDRWAVFTRLRSLHLEKVRLGRPTYAITLSFLSTLNISHCSLTADVTSPVFSPNVLPSLRTLSLHDYGQIASSFLDTLPSFHLDLLQICERGDLKATHFRHPFPTLLTLSSNDLSLSTLYDAPDSIDKIRRLAPSHIRFLPDPAQAYSAHAHKNLRDLVAPSLVSLHYPRCKWARLDPPYDDLLKACKDCNVEVVYFEPEEEDLGRVSLSFSRYVAAKRLRQ
ncbi:hypothetical protein JCM8547_008964 [Rhodosporidiobolus lusitaniae]